MDNPVKKIWQKARWETLQTVSECPINIWKMVKILVLEDMQNKATMRYYSHL